MIRPRWWQQCSPVFCCWGLRCWVAGRPARIPRRVPCRWPRSRATPGEHRLRLWLRFDELPEGPLAPGTPVEDSSGLGNNAVVVMSGGLIRGTKSVGRSRCSRIGRPVRRALRQGARLRPGDPRDHGRIRAQSRVGRLLLRCGSPAATRGPARWFERRPEGFLDGGGRAVEAPGGRRARVPQLHTGRLRHRGDRPCARRSHSGGRELAQDHL